MNIDKFKAIFDTKQKKTAAGISLAVIVAAVGGTYYAFRDTGPELVLKSKTIVLEYGEKFNVKDNFSDLIDTKGMNKDEIHELQHDTKIESDIENEKTEVKDEAGNITGEEEKEYPPVGKYTISLKYKDKTLKQNIEVKDTKEPELTIPESIEILQGTDLNTFDFKSLIPATDLSEIGEYTFDFSGIDVNVPGEYTLKVTVPDKYDNKTENDVKVVVIAPPALASDEVVVQEEVTNADGTKSIKNTVKKKTDATQSGNKVIVDNNPAPSTPSNSGTGSSGGSSGNSSSGSGGSGSNKPSGGSGSGGNTGGSGSTGGSGNTGGSGSSGGSSSGGSGSTGGESSKPTEHEEWFTKCSCGYRVTSSISLEDSWNKFLSHWNSWGDNCSSYQQGNYWVKD